MATKTEVEISRDRIGLARAEMGAVETFRQHAEQIVGFWQHVIAAWKYPQGQARHGGRLWRKRMDEQITMELADLNTYWPTMLSQLDLIDKLHVEAQTEILVAFEKLQDVDDGFGFKVGDATKITEALTALRAARAVVQEAINVRNTGNREGKKETEL